MTAIEIVKKFMEYAEYDPEQKKFNLLSARYEYHRCISLYSDDRIMGNRISINGSDKDGHAFELELTIKEKKDACTGHGGGMW